MSNFVEVLCTEVADCVEDSTCVRTPQSPGYVCLCPGGYFGDGRESGDGCIPPGGIISNSIKPRLH